MAKREWSRYLGFALVGLCLAAFFPVLHFGFLTQADVAHVVANPRLSGPFSAIWSSTQLGLYVPVTHSLWWLMANLAGLDPAWFHFLNWTFHAINVALVWILLRRLGHGTLASALGTLVFGLHPVQVEAVAWVMALKGVLATTLVLLCLIAALSERWLLATFCFFAALLAKPIAAGAPVMVAVLFWIADRPLRKAAPWLAGWSVASAALLLFTKSLQPGPVLGPWEKTLVLSDSLLFGLAKTFMPVGLAYNYGRTPEFIVERGPGVALAALVLTLLLLWRRRRDRWVLAAFVLWVLPWLPVSGFASFFSQVNSTTSDRFLYLGFLGVAFGLAHAFDKGIFGALGRKPVFAVVLTVGLFAMTRFQLRHWRGELSLYERAVRVSPTAENRHNFGLALKAAGRDGLAIELLGEAATQNPWEPAYANELAIALVEQGKLDEAERELRAALAWMPESPTLNANLAVLKKHRTASKEKEVHP